MPPNPPFLLFTMPLWQTFYSYWMFTMLAGLIVLTLAVDTLQRVSLRNARGDRCKTSFVNRMVAELMLFGVHANMSNPALPNSMLSSLMRPFTTSTVRP